MEVKLMKSAFEIIINNSKDIMFVKDEFLIYRAASAAFVKMTGNSSVSDIIGHTDLEIFENKELAKRYISDDHRLLSKEEDLTDYVEPITDDHGKARYGSTSKYILRDEKRKAIGILGITKDITTEYLVRKRYQQELKYLFELPKDTYAVCYIDVDDWRIISQRRQNITGETIQLAQTVEEVCNYAVESIIDKESRAEEFYSHFTSENLHEIYSDGRRMLTFKYERKFSDDIIRWVRNEVNFITDVDSGHLCIMLSAKDINSIKQEEQRILEGAQLDSMTKLLNHETSMECINKILYEENDKQHALFMLDIDNFKSLNDTLGHQAGDKFLIDFANELKNRFRETDIVGRIGGDEFFALMKNIFDRGQIERRAMDILEIIKKTAQQFPEVKLGGSIGISLYPKDGTNLDVLYTKADEALYESKRNGKNQYKFAE